jgi:hypothetical protein
VSRDDDRLRCVFDCLDRLVDRRAGGLARCCRVMMWPALVGLPVFLLAVWCAFRLSDGERL